MADPENTRVKREDGMPVGKPFTAGNPGRPKGARSRLGEAFLEAMHASFEEHGVRAIQDVIKNKPDQYLKVIASLMPKQLDLDEEAAANVVRALTVAFVRPGEQRTGDGG